MNYRPVRPHNLCPMSVFVPTDLMKNVNSSFSCGEAWTDIALVGHRLSAAWPAAPAEGGEIR